MAPAPRCDGVARLENKAFHFLKLLTGKEFDW